MIPNRCEIKYNFLRRILIRLDYNGIIKIEDTLMELQKLMPKFGFVEMNNGFINEVEFELNDPITMENDTMIPLREVKRTETFKFKNRDRSIEFEVNKLFMALTINTESYHEFEVYRDMFIEIFDLIKSGNTYLQAVRLGLRKINNCILKEKDNFKLYFNSNYFRDTADLFTKDGFESKMLVGNHSDTISKDRYWFNYIRSLSDAVLNLNNKKLNVYQVAIDIDGYSTKKEWLKEIISDKERFKLALDEINGYLFIMYINSLTTEFVEKLKSDNQEWNEILGVRSNDN